MVGTKRREQGGEKGEVDNGVGTQEEQNWEITGRTGMRHKKTQIEQNSGRVRIWRTEYREREQNGEDCSEQREQSGELEEQRENIRKEEQSGKNKAGRKEQIEQSMKEVPGRTKRGG